MPEIKSYDHDHENEVALFAETNYRNVRRQFGIKTDDRRRHTYVIGKTGMGKTTMLENLLMHDIVAGHGVAYIDPHGDTVQNILDFIPPNRINDVIYFNPSDLDNPIGFNILESVDETHKHLVAAGLMAVFKKIWPDVWSARMEYILLNTILALLDAPGSTLLGINRLLVDEEYRKRVVSLIQDPVVKTFWVKEFAAFSEKYRTEAIAPVQNKVGQFLSAAIIRNIVAQVKSTIDMRDIMDNRKILLVNLSKGLVGEENSRLLGAMLITRLQLAAMERVDIPEKSRQDFYLYVDEFQNFATESFANILSEARKYRLNLIVAHQYIEQLDEKVQAAIFGNVGTIVSFRVGAPDAEPLAREFSPQFTEEDMVNLKKFDIYLRLMIDGAASEPFSASTLPPIAQRTGSTEKVVRVSRERYSTPRAKIEDKVLRWSGMGSVDAGATIDVLDAEDEDLAGKLKELEAKSPQIAEAAGSAGFKKKDKDKPVHKIPCSVCGKIQELSFEPDWSRPWFCKDDLEKRSQQATAPRAMPARPMPAAPIVVAVQPVSLNALRSQPIQPKPASLDAAKGVSQPPKNSTVAPSNKISQRDQRPAGNRNEARPPVAKPMVAARPPSAVARPVPTETVSLSSLKPRPTKDEPTSARPKDEREITEKKTVTEIKQAAPAIVPAASPVAKTANVRLDVEVPVVTRPVVAPSAPTEIKAAPASAVVPAAVVTPKVEKSVPPTLVDDKIPAPSPKIDPEISIKPEPSLPSAEISTLPAVKPPTDVQPSGPATLKPGQIIKFE